MIDNYYKTNQRIYYNNRIRIIYKKKNSKKDYIKSKGEYILIKKYNKIKGGENIDNILNIGIQTYLQYFTYLQTERIEKTYIATQNDVEIPTISFIHIDRGIRYITKLIHSYNRIKNIYEISIKTLNILDGLIKQLLNISNIFNNEFDKRINICLKIIILMNEVFIHFNLNLNQYLEHLIYKRNIILSFIQNNNDDNVLNEEQKKEKERKKRDLIIITNEYIEIYNNILLNFYKNLLLFININNNELKKDLIIKINNILYKNNINNREQFICDYLNTNIQLKNNKRNIDDKIINNNSQIIKNIDLLLSYCNNNNRIYNNFIFNKDYKFDIITSYNDIRNFDIIKNYIFIITDINKFINIFIYYIDILNIYISNYNYNYKNKNNKIRYIDIIKNNYNYYKYTKYNIKIIENNIIFEETF